MEASAHVLPCFQAPVHPWSFTCSLVWNQLQESSCHPLLLCQPYPSGSHQSLALTEGNSISCDGQTETEGQLKSLFCSFPLSSCSLEMHKFSPILGSLCTVRMGEGFYLSRSSLLQWGGKGQKGNTYQGEGCTFPWSSSALVLLPKMQLGAWEVVPCWMVCDVLLAKSDSNNETSLSFSAAICSGPTTVAISGFYQTCGLIPSTPRGRREGERGRRRGMEYGR